MLDPGLGPIQASKAEELGPAQQSILRDYFL